jgi:hypothetical protein
MLTPEQKDAVRQVATALGWDQMTLADFEKVAWCAFHYLAMRFHDAARS